MDGFDRDGFLVREDFASEVPRGVKGVARISTCLFTTEVGFMLMRSCVGDSSCSVHSVPRLVFSPHRVAFQVLGYEEEPGEEVRARVVACCSKCRFGLRLIALICTACRHC